MRTVVFLAWVCLVQAKFYDLTTIYRLADYPVKVNETSEKASRDAAGDCLVGVGSNRCVGWKHPGWEETDSGVFGVSFPSTVTKTLALDINNSTSKIKLTSNMFDVKIKFVTDAREKITFIFSTQEQDYDSHLLVFQMPADDLHGGNAAYRCLRDQEGQVLFRFDDGLKRRCGAIDVTQNSQPSELEASGNVKNYRVTMSPTNMKIFNTFNQLVTIFDIQHIKQLKDLKYFRIIAQGEVSVSTPSSVLQMTQMEGSLVSPSLSHANSAHLCLSFSTFMDPRSEASLTIYAQYAKGRRMDIGLISAATNNVLVFGNTSLRYNKSWKFVTLVDPSESQTFKFHIEADRLHKYPVLIGDISSCKQNDLVEVHARTNARGMPFSLDNKTVIEPNVGSIFPLCIAEDDKCDWTLDNWSLLRLTSNYDLPLLSEHQLFHEYTSQANVTKAMLYERPLRFRFVPSNVYYRNDCWMAILLCGEDCDLINDDFYVIHIHGYEQSSSMRGAKVWRCIQDASEDNLYIFEGHSRYCSSMYNSQVNSAYQFYTGGEQLDIKLTVTNGRILVKVNATTIIDWTDDQPLNVRNFAFSTRYMYGEYISGFDVFDLSEESGTITSPLIDMATSLCVVLDYFSTDGSTVNVTAHASVNNNDLVISDGKIETSTQYTMPRTAQKGWKHDIFKLDIPSSNVNRRGRIVVKATKTHDSKLLIQRISGCNMEALEDVHVFHKSSDLIIRSPGFDVAAIDRTEKLGSIKWCYHGGRVDLKDNTSCICPSGFTGVRCEQGCGANSYGDDCGGKCSATGRQCRGMLLCRPLLGCACAPGLTGSLCDTPCLDGQFGANCEQRCGNCVNSTRVNGGCDMFTGKCRQGCQPGYYPPLCHEEYSLIISAPTLENVGNSVSVSFDLADAFIKGNPKFYQLQYKHPGEPKWFGVAPKQITSSITSLKTLNESEIHQNILPGLKPGREYEVRVVLIDQDGNSYQGYKVPVALINTTCTLPEKFDFDLQGVNVTEDSFGVQWTDPFAKGLWCPLERYELYRQMGWQWIKKEYGAGSSQDMFTDLLPSNKYQVKVRAVTALGVSTYSPVLVIKTLQAKVLDRVVDLSIAPSPSSDVRKLVVKWRPPENEDETSVRRYKVTFQCLHLLACPAADCSGSVGNIETRTTSVVLGDLLPFARYNVTVSGVSGSVGLPSSIQGATDGTVPNISPVLGSEPVVDRTNSSYTIQWESPAKCDAMNGYLIGYHYLLVNPNHSAPLLEGDTTATSVAFTDLDPHTTYTVKVFAVTPSGWNPNHPLTFSAKTRATTPAVVEDLTVYKRGRRMLGLRWSKPQLTYGVLSSFTVTHHVTGQKPISKKVDAEFCTAWPDLYCHTLHNLASDQEYRISVQARNTEVNEDGDKVSVVGITKEGAPGVPSLLRVVNQTESSVTVEWKLPEMINGQLRSFLVNIEETDSANSSELGRDYPMKEVVVRSEELSYHFELTDLHAASTYLVSVSGKTVSLGPSISLTAHTRPPTPVLMTSPRLTAATWRRGASLGVVLEPSSQYQDLVSGYMLLIASNETGGAPLAIKDKFLSEEINKLGKTLYLVAEFTKDQLDESKTVMLDEFGTPKEGRFGVLSFPRPSAAISYQLVQVVVLDYCGSLSMGSVSGDFFTANVE